MSAATLSDSNSRRNEDHSAAASPDPESSELRPASRLILRKELRQEPEQDAPPPSIMPDLRKEVEMEESELTAYLSRLSREGDAVEIRVKNGPATAPRKLDRIAELHRLLLEKQVWGAQVMHRTAGVRVVDTLRVRPGGILRVRTRR